MYGGRKTRVLHGADTLNKLPNGYRVNLKTTEGLKNQSLRGSCGSCFILCMVIGEESGEAGNADAQWNWPVTFKACQTGYWRENQLHQKAVEPGENGRESPITARDLPVLMSLCKFLLAFLSMRNYTLEFSSYGNQCELPFIFHELNSACFCQLYSYECSMIMIVLIHILSIFPRNLSYRDRKKKDYFPANYCHSVTQKTELQCSGEKNPWEFYHYRLIIFLTLIICIDAVLVEHWFIYTHIEKLNFCFCILW